MQRHAMSKNPAERIRSKRVYRAARNSDGKRILVDRLWPRGMSKERARLWDWEKDVAPSDDLRRWFHAHPNEWIEFRSRYLAELENLGKHTGKLLGEAQNGVVTLVYGSADDEHNNAVVLRDHLLDLIKRGTRVGTETAEGNE